MVQGDLCSPQTMTQALQPCRATQTNGWVQYKSETRQKCAGHTSETKDQSQKQYKHHHVSDKHLEPLQNHIKGSRRSEAKQPHDSIVFRRRVWVNHIHIQGGSPETAPKCLQGNQPSIQVGTSTIDGQGKPLAPGRNPQGCVQQLQTIELFLAFLMMALHLFFKHILLFQLPIIILSVTIIPNDTRTPM